MPNLRQLARNNKFYVCGNTERLKKLKGLIGVGE
jgi:hypothetical protein